MWSVAYQSLGLWPVSPYGNYGFKTSQAESDLDFELHNGCTSVKRSQFLQAQLKNLDGNILHLNIDFEERKNDQCSQTENEGRGGLPRHISAQNKQSCQRTTFLLMI